MNKALLSKIYTIPIPEEDGSEKFAGNIIHLISKIPIGGGFKSNLSFRLSTHKDLNIGYNRFPIHVQAVQFYQTEMLDSSLKLDQLEIEEKNKEFRIKGKSKP